MSKTIKHDKNDDPHKHVQAGQCRKRPGWAGRFRKIDFRAPGAKIHFGEKATTTDATQCDATRRDTMRRRRLIETRRRKIQNLKFDRIRGQISNLEFCKKNDDGDRPTD